MENLCNRTTDSVGVVNTRPTRQKQRRPEAIFTKNFILPLGARSFSLKPIHKTLTSKIYEGTLNIRVRRGLTSLLWMMSFF